MKDLVQFILEKSDPSTADFYDPKDWEIVLRAIQNENGCGNYSQNWFDEYLEEDEVEGIDMWKADHPELYTAAVKAIGDDAEANMIINQIFSFVRMFYKVDGHGSLSYKYEDEDIVDWKNKHIFKGKGKNKKKDPKATDFGIEKEDYYEPWLYTGPANYKPWAQMIAKYSDCSEDYSDFEY